MWIDDYIALMDGVTISLDNIEAAQLLKDKHLPSSIFRYRPIDEYSLSNFEDDTVWVSIASKYNDPYDSALTWSVQATWDVSVEQHSEAFRADLVKHELDKFLSVGELDEIRKSTDPSTTYLRFWLKKKNISQEKIEEFILNQNSSRNKFLGDGVREMAKRLQNSYKICSFSARSNSILMWGHYAKNHTGFLVEYDLTKLDANSVCRLALVPVIYTRELYDSTKHMTQCLKGKNKFNNLFAFVAAMHKSEEWNYEEEWRLIIPDGDELEGWNFAMPKPKAVYLGARISLENEEKIIAIAVKKKIPIYRMELAHNEFLMVAKEHKIGI